MVRFLRNLKDGTIYDWHPILADNPKVEEITEEEAFPERFMPVETVAKVEVARKKRGRPALDLTTTDIPEPPPYTDPELAAEAAKGFPT